MVWYLQYNPLIKSGGVSLLLYLILMTFPHNMLMWMYKVEWGLLKYLPGSLKDTSFPKPLRELTVSWIIGIASFNRPVTNA